MIRSTTHYFKDYINTNKLTSISNLIDEYRRVMSLILDDIWNNGYYDSYLDEKTNSTKFIEFNISENKFDLPSYLDYSRFSYIKTDLSARILSSLVTQLVGVIKSSVEKTKSRWYVYQKELNEGNYKPNLLQKILNFPPVKPSVEHINLELSSKCTDFQFTDKFFNGFVRLKSLGSQFESINIPIKFHKVNKKYKDWNMMTSFLIGKDFINIRFQKDEPEMKNDGITVGADQGLKTVITLSDKQITSKNNHGHDLDSILNTMIRKKKGSKAYKKCQDHRTNYINWSINQLNFNNIKQINIEEVTNIGYKNPTTRKLACWTNTNIRDKIVDRCTLLGVQVKHQSPTYKSQRCSDCGHVRKSNRKGKEYICSNCGLIIDADYNASLNHSIDLPDIPYKLRCLNLNRKGFFWNETGFYDLNGVELESHLSQEKS